MSNDMRLEVKLYATLAAHLPDEADSYPGKEGMTVLDLMNRLGIDPAKVKLIFVNGLKKDPDEKLTDGDRVGLFPPVGGG
jgi:molybdopterin converting factor small subunit